MKGLLEALVGELYGAIANQTFRRKACKRSLASFLKALKSRGSLMQCSSGTCLSENSASKPVSKTAARSWHQLKTLCHSLSKSEELSSLNVGLNYAFDTRADNHQNKIFALF